MRNFQKTLIGWYFYDFASSVFSTTVITVFLGPYFTSLAEQSSDISNKINFLGINIAAGSFFPLIVAISVILQALFLPFFSFIADNTRFKKHILFISAYIGALSTLSLYFIEASNYLYGAILFIIANVCFGLSCSIYNSYLNHITTKDKATSVSSIGWAFGYIGGGLLLLLNLLFFNNSLNFNIEEGLATRICLCSAGVWWAIFTLIPLRYLPAWQKDSQSNHILQYTVVKLKQYLQKHTTKSDRNVVESDLTHTESPDISRKLTKKQFRLFLFSYMLYNDGVQSVIVLAAQFGSAELGLRMETLIFCILIVQFVAFFGTLLFSFVAKNIGELLTLKITLLLWIGVIVFAYGFLHTENEFYILCCLAGSIMGATQALSRSIYSKLIPLGKEASYFSIYELSEKGTSWLGPMAFAIVYNITFSYRIAILTLVIFFIFGFILLHKGTMLLPSRR